MTDQENLTSKLEQLPLEEQNQELLRNSELGVFMERAYMDAVRLDPRLADIKVVAIDEESTPVAAASPSWASESGNHEIHVRLNNLDEALSKHQEILDTVPGSRELFAEKMGLKPEEVTPAALHVFSTLHEMGHLTEYMDHEADPDSLRQRARREKAALPIGNASVSAIMTPGSAARELVDNNWAEISDKYGVDTIDQLLELQHAAHRGMTSERIADEFAADVFALDPELVGVLISPETVDEYIEQGSKDNKKDELTIDDPIKFAVDYAVNAGRTSKDLETELETFTDRAGRLVQSIRSTSEKEGRDLSDKEINKIKDIALTVSRQREVIKALKDREQKVA